jgi:hypothetical protein
MDSLTHYRIATRFLIGVPLFTLFFTDKFVFLFWRIYLYAFYDCPLNFHSAETQYKNSIDSRVLS